MAGAMIPVRLSIGDVTSEIIGEIEWPVQIASGGKVLGNGQAVVNVTVAPAAFDEVRGSLAGLLRAAADEIETSSD